MHARVGLVPFKMVGDLARVLHVSAIAEGDRRRRVSHPLGVRWDATNRFVSVENQIGQRGNDYSSERVFLRSGYSTHCVS